MHAKKKPEEHSISWYSARGPSDLLRLRLRLLKLRGGDFGRLSVEDDF